MLLSHDVTMVLEMLILQFKSNAGADPALVRVRQAGDRSILYWQDGRVSEETTPRCKNQLFHRSDDRQVFHPPAETVTISGQEQVVQAYDIAYDFKQFWAVSRQALRCG